MTEEDDGYENVGTFTRTIDHTNEDGSAWGVAQEATPIYMCQLCGSAVVERKMHDEWHDDLAITHNRAMVAVDAEDADDRNPMARVPQPGPNWDWACEQLEASD